MDSNLTLKEINRLMRKASGCEDEERDDCKCNQHCSCCKCKCKCKCNCNCKCPEKPEKPECPHCPEHPEKPEKPECPEKPDCPECPPPLTPIALSAHNFAASTIRVEERGTVIPLPSITYDRGFLPTLDHKSFTVEETGFYSIDYVIYIDKKAHLSAAVFRNDHELFSTGVSPLPPADFFIATTIEFLEKGDHISLVLFGEDKTVELRPRTGASLKVIRIA